LRGGSHETYVMGEELTRDYYDWITASSVPS